jgi:hypothetical protein
VWLTVSVDHRGFRRTVQFPVDQGVIAYQCSLFQRDQPQLVAHMRMDSDVQDVFAKHSESEGADIPFDPKRIGKASYASQGASSKSRAPAPSERPGGPQASRTNFGLATTRTNNVQNLEGPAGLSTQGTPTGGDSLFNNSNPFQSLSIEQLRQLTQATGLTRLLASPSQAGLLAANPPVDGMGSPARAASADAMAKQSKVLGQILGKAEPVFKKPSDMQQNAPPAVATAPEEMLLNLILILTEEYLNHPNPSTHSNSDSIRIALQLLKLQIQKGMEGKAKQKAEEESKKPANNGPLGSWSAQGNEARRSSPTITELVMQATRSPNPLGFAPAGHAGSKRRGDPSALLSSTLFADQQFQLQTPTESDGHQLGNIQQLLSQAQGASQAARHSLTMSQHYQPQISAAALISQLGPGAIDQLMMMQNPTRQNRTW